MSCQCPGYEQRGELLGSHGPAKEKALSLGAVMGFQESKLLGSFDALRHDSMFEAHAHRNDGADDNPWLQRANVTLTRSKENSYLLQQLGFLGVTPPKL